MSPAGAASPPVPSGPLDEELASARRQGLGPLPADMPGWMAGTIRGIDRLNHAVGRIAAWLVLPLMLAMVYEVGARYLFSRPTLWAYDTSRMLYGAFFMLGAAYGLSRGIHVRADFLYQRLDVRTQGRIDLALYLVLYFPALIVFLTVGFDYALTAVLRHERGMDTAWMPLLGPIKSVLPVSVALLLLQGVAESLKCYYAATRGRWPDA